MNYVISLFFPLVALAQTVVAPTSYNAPFTPIPQEVVTIPIEEEKAPEIAESSQPEPVKDCSCVNYIRSRGVSMPILVNASNLDITLNSPPVRGGIVKTVYNGVYHLSYIERIEADGIYISEQNYSKDPDCPVTYRVLDFLDPHIIGFTRTGYSNEPTTSP